MAIENPELKTRIIDISYRHKLSHLGSNLSAVDIINRIYEIKNPPFWKAGWDEKFVLSSGHAGLALYVVLEKFGFGDAEELFKKHGVHPNVDVAHGIYVSTGSLGQGLPIATGLALAERRKNVYCLISDGECPEGSIWESLRVAREQRLDNLKVHLNLNGYGAYDPINRRQLVRQIKAFGFPVDIHMTRVDQLPFLKGLSAHYYTMTEDDYLQAMKGLKNGKISD